MSETDAPEPAPAPVAPTPTLLPEHVPLVAELERLAATLRAEVLAVPATDYVAMPSRDRYSGDWRAVLFSVGPWEHEYPGVDFERNRRSCPTIASVLSRHPEVKLCGALSLGPGAVLQPHADPRQDREIRVHLALALPPAEADAWPVGTCRLLDVRQKHGANNPGEEPRITLVFDVLLDEVVPDGAVAPWPT